MICPGTCTWRKKRKSLSRGMANQQVCSSALRLKTIGLITAWSMIRVFWRELNARGKVCAQEKASRSRILAINREATGYVPPALLTYGSGAADPHRGCRRRGVHALGGVGGGAAGGSRR